MTAPRAGSPPAPSGPAGAQYQPSVDPGDRGSLHIADSVVARIAQTAASEVPDIISVSRSVFGLPIGSRQPARVRASVNDTRARLQVNLAVRYPCNVVAVAEAVRRAVAARVGQLAGMAVLEVDVNVDQLSAPPAPARVS